jgi:hypothetical protein
LVTNALSRRNNYVDNKHDNEGKEIASLDAITKMVRAWYEEIYCSYKYDVALQNIITGKMIDVNKYLNYTHEEGIERYEERIIAGGKGSLIG